MEFCRIREDNNSICVEYLYLHGFVYILFMDAEFLYADISSVNYEFANWLNVSEISDSFRRCALFEFN